MFDCTVMASWSKVQLSRGKNEQSFLFEPLLHRNRYLA